MANATTNGTNGRVLLPGRSQLPSGSWRGRGTRHARLFFDLWTLYQPDVGRQILLAFEHFRAADLAKSSTTSKIRLEGPIQMLPLDEVVRGIKHGRRVARPLLRCALSLRRPPTQLASDEEEFVTKTSFALHTSCSTPSTVL